MSRDELEITSGCLENGFYFDNSLIIIYTLNISRHEVLPFVNLILLQLVLT